MTTLHDSFDDRADGLEDKRERARRRLGQLHPRCSTPMCGEDEPIALVRVGERIVCAECLACEQGRSWTEAHHIAGRRNLDLTVVVPLNTHRVLSARQEDWMTHTLRNPDQSPLLRAAAALRGILDFFAELVHKSVGWIPELLERIEESLCATYGPDWWVELDLGPAIGRV